MQIEKFLARLCRNCLVFWRDTSPDAVNIFGDFSPREFAAALHHLKPGKAPGPDSICPELLIHAGPGLKSWLRGFLSSCLRQLKIRKVWRRALVVAIPKPSKSVENPKSYPSISLLCDSYKILERTNNRPLASKGTGWISTQKVYRGPGRFAYVKH